MSDADRNGQTRGRGWSPVGDARSRAETLLDLGTFVVMLPLAVAAMAVAFAVEIRGALAPGAEAPL